MATSTIKLRNSALRFIDISGTSTTHSEIVNDILSSLSDITQTTAFYGFHRCSGTRLVWGYLYSNREYGHIMWITYDGKFMSAYINNGEITIKAISSS